MYNILETLMRGHVHPRRTPFILFNTCTIIHIFPPSNLLFYAHSGTYDVVVQEEAISIVLQLLALAVFDSILVGMLQIIAPDTWQPLKHSLCDAFSRNKNQQVRARDSHLFL